MKLLPNTADRPPAGRHRRVEPAPTELRAALLDPEGGAGAELHGHVPDDPAAVVLLLHGGAEAGRMPVAWWRPPVLRMVPIALALARRAPQDLLVLRLKYRVRGWNGTRQDPVHDARWAMDRIRRILPGLPIVLVGHSMGGRVALHLAAEPQVAGVAALAPWVESDARRPRPGIPVLLMHGTRDQITDPRRTGILARRFADQGVEVRHVRVYGGDHAMLREAAMWHDTVTDFVTDVLRRRGRTS